MILLAKQDPHLAALFTRIHAVVFFATPHHTTDSAMLLNILQVSIGPSMRPPYIGSSSLEQDSFSIQEINTRFRQIDRNLDLYAFYENEKTKLGLCDTMIVGKDAATFGTFLVPSRLRLVL